MLTLKKNKETIQIASLVSGKKKTPVYWFPTIRDELMNNVNDLSSFNTNHFRDVFELSEQQASDIFTGLKEESVVERNQSKYFKVKRHIRDSLLSEMDISDSKGTFEIDFDENPEKYTGHFLICGGTGSGKTFWGVQQILRNLDGPKHLRRHFLIISSEWNEDSTLKPLKADKYQQFVHGVDVSEDSYKESEWHTKEDFFKNEIKLKVDFSPKGSIIFLDDSMDCVVPQMVRRMINRGLRVYRHKGISLMVILHSIRSGSWSSQAYNSIRYLVLFPRSQKGKITNYLNQDVGLPLKEAREAVRQFSQTGRYMIVRIHSPELLIGPKLIKVI